MDLNHLFSGAAMKAAVIVPGSKASNTTEALLTSLKSANKFSLSRPAMQLLGVTSGSELMIIDLARVHKPELLDENKRFFIAVVNREGENPAATGAKVGKTGSFSYSLLQGTMLLNDTSRVEVSTDELVEKGLGKMLPAYTFENVKDENGNDIIVDGEPKMRKVENGLRFSANYIVKYKLEATGIKQVLVPGSEPVELFLLTERQVEEAPETEEREIKPRKSRKNAETNGSEIDAPEVDDDGEDNEEAFEETTADITAEEDGEDGEGDTDEDFS